jgi:hypothetical protein
MSVLLEVVLLDVVVVMVFERVLCCSLHTTFGSVISSHVANTVGFGLSTKPDTENIKLDGTINRDIISRLVGFIYSLFS